MQPADEPIGVRDGRLTVEACDARGLAEQFGTPLYVVSATMLRANVARHVAAWSAAWREGPFQLLPALKGQNVLAVWRLLAATGVGCDVFGHHELAIALRAGIPPERISLNGSKRPAHIADAVARGVRLTVDHVDELGEIRDAAAAAGRPAHVRVRIRPDLTAYDAPSDFAPDEVPIGLATQVYKPGVPLADLVAVDPAELAPYVELMGVHQHAARHSGALAFWEAVATATMTTIAALRDAWDGWLPREIDLGGGFPSPRDGVGGRIERVAQGRDVRPVEEYAAAVTRGAADERRRRSTCPSTACCSRPSPAARSSPTRGIHLATVNRVKRQSAPLAWAWVELDTADVFLSDVITEHARFAAVVADRAEAPATQVADLVGCSCNWDQLTEQESLPDVAPGDVIAFLGTGCYEEVSAANFNALPRPATVLVDGAEAYVVRRAETPRRRAQPRRLTTSGSDSTQTTAIAVQAAASPAASASAPPPAEPRNAPGPHAIDWIANANVCSTRVSSAPCARSEIAGGQKMSHAATASDRPRGDHQRPAEVRQDHGRHRRQHEREPQRRDPPATVDDAPGQGGDRRPDQRREHEHRRDPGGADAEPVELQRQQRAQHPEQRARDDHEPEAEQHVVVADRRAQAGPLAVVLRGRRAQAREQHDRAEHDERRARRT